ncbi:hypothetical protein CWB99_11280 [Pseudoalteromonas rubra]|uniref:Uncharacterized protein n=1 Tax=Pseudoalteromonas rubra TaxID=43658 RepID=A0A5S3WMU5_9GAMM|nr:hypothetical protein [Pseudoalteromonas rubra]TMP28488.1 hypothetical protein CWB99_11280 [Pseudoalteromonas rubra]
MHPLEVLFLNDPDEEANEFNKSFSGTAQSFPSIESLSFYQQGHLPYGVVEFYANPSLSDRSKCNNSAALDMGIDGVDTSSWVQPVAVEAPRESEATTTQTTEKVVKLKKKPWWKIW